MKPLLGCFAVLECLLTHKPGKYELGDSLTRQLKTKIAFLEGISGVSLDFSLFQNPGAPKNWDSKAKERIWSELYEYRSFLAHGSHFTFKGDLPNLVSPMAAQSFVRQAAKQILVFALEQPNLLEGLKAV